MASTNDDAYVLSPALPDAAHALYERLLRGLRRCGQQGRSPQALLAALLRDVEAHDLTEPDRLSVRLCLQVLDDLAGHGWQFVPHDGGRLKAVPPDVARRSGRERRETKRRLRAQLVAARDEQLREPSVRQFVEKMERPRWHQGRQVSVQDVFADPEALADDLERRLRADPALRASLLHDLVDPYLQQVTDARDAFTGLRLRDIWRYCRYTWSLPQKTQPGRRMKYLVRDAARPFHPVMGIGALGSSIVQITCRDAAIGWTLDALRQADAPAARLDALERELARSIDEIYRDDFVAEGALAEREAERPTQSTLDRLDRLVANTSRSGERLKHDAPLEEAARAPRSIVL
jgi:hypothetical protein